MDDMTFGETVQVIFWIIVAIVIVIGMAVAF
jgi:hypothetical protein